MGKTVSIQDVFLLIEWFLAKYLIIDFSIEKKKTQVFKEIPKTFFFLKLSLSQILFLSKSQLPLSLI